MKKTNTLTLSAGIAALLAAFAIFFWLDLPTRREQTFAFASTYKGEAVTLKASYWEAENAEYAVLICPGYSCDRQKWRPFADLFVSSGCTTMTFDYSGQGASGGTIGFDNAKTDSIPVQIGDAIEQLHRRSGIPYERIILAGHSMGGRSILRLLYDYNEPTAETAVQKRPIGNVILISPEVNYHFNAQASLFAGTSDETEEPWHSYHEGYTAGTNVYLFGSTADDIVSDEDVLSIYRRLGGTDVPESGSCSASRQNGVGSRVTVGVTTGVLHSYQMYSPKFAAFVNAALTEITGQPARYAAGSFSLIYAGWLLALAGLALTLSALERRAGWVVRDEVPRLEQPRVWLAHKALLWLPGTVAAVLICCLCVCAPFGSPVMNIPYMCFIAGYGLVMLWAYRKGRLKGTCGRLPKPTLALAGTVRDWLTGLAVAAGCCALVWYVLRATMYRLLPLNARLFWVLLAALLMAAGYYVSGCEADMLAQANASSGVRLAYNILQYVPLFLLVLFYLALKSYSGLIGQVQNIVLMYVFCIPLGSYLRKKTGNRLVGALVTAFLFQTLMITSAALISMF